MMRRKPGYVKWTIAKGPLAVMFWHMRRNFPWKEGQSWELKMNRCGKKKVAQGPITDAPKIMQGSFIFPLNYSQRKWLVEKIKRIWGYDELFLKTKLQDKNFKASWCKTMNYNFYLWHITEICQVEILRPQSARLQHLCLFLSDWGCHVCTLVTWQTGCVCLKHCSPVWNSAT